MNVFDPTHTMLFFHVSLLHLLGNRDEPGKCSPPSNEPALNKQPEEVCTEEQ